MWYCLDCVKRFEMSDNFSEKTCPFCFSENVRDFSNSDFQFPKMDGLVPQVGKDSFKAAMDSFGINKEDYEQLDLDEAELPEWNFELSFADLDINEFLLLDLPVEDVVPINYITKMNELFLHTFVDGCFVPA